MRKRILQNKNLKPAISIVCAMVLSLSSCVQKIDLSEGDIGKEDETILKENFFDFNTIEDFSMQINYGYQGAITFSLYDVYPMELVEDSWDMKEGLLPIYSAVTNENGVFSKSVKLPAYHDKLWLMTEHLLIASPIEIDAKNGIINFDYANYKHSLATTRSNITPSTLLAGYETLGDWNEEGIPNYLLAEKTEIPDAFLKRCNTLASSVAMDQTPLLDKHPELTATGTNDMMITKTTGLVATYFKSTSGWENMVAYYTYQDGEEMDLDKLANLKKTILFPRYSSKAPQSLLGEQVQIKYWNKETEAYEDEFPAGTRIGWVLLGMGWTTNSPRIRYSNPAFNSDNTQRSVLLSDPELDNCFFMAMEDNVDYRFNDALFAIIASQSNSVEQTPIIPDQVDKGEVFYKISGSLAYEDNWPVKGDYDMNDVVMNFISTVVKEKDTDKVVRTTSTFTAVNNGAMYTNGFGFQLDNILSRQVTSLTISFNGNIISEEFEEGTDKPVVILFDDIRSYLNKPFTVVIEYSKFTNGGVFEENALPPYNPFVFSQGREREIHLAGYKPTSKADASLRGTKDDISMDDNGNEMYYTAKDNMPYGLYISGSYFNYPAENEDIRDKYPHFEDWVKSFGQEYKDWYLQPE